MSKSACSVFHLKSITTAAPPTNHHTTWQAELSPPSHERPAEGRLEVNVEVAPLALLNRESAREPEDLNADLSKVNGLCLSVGMGGEPLTHHLYNYCRTGCMAPTLPTVL